MCYSASKVPNIQHIHTDAVKLLSFAAEARLKDFLEKLSTVVCHRMNNYRVSFTSRAAVFVRSS